jgi:hypothetical protein
MGNNYPNCIEYRIIIIKNNIITITNNFCGTSYYWYTVTLLERRCAFLRILFESLIWVCSAVSLTPSVEQKQKDLVMG